MQENGILNLVNQQSMLVLFSLCDVLGTTECSMMQYQEFAMQVQNGKSRNQPKEKFNLKSFNIEQFELLWHLVI